MAKFVGTLKEFHRYIGPRLRNLVQMKTKCYKQQVGKCEHCGDKQAELDAAHKHGFDRKDIISHIYSEISIKQHDNSTIDMEYFEKKFIEQHSPMSKAVLILCKSCHIKYDNKRNSQPINLINNSEKSADLLPIELHPHDSNEFLDKILITKNALIKIHYTSGQVEEKIWRVSRLSRTSNILGNLRSRPEFRNNRWQTLGISKVIVQVIES